MYTKRKRTDDVMEFCKKEFKRILDNSEPDYGKEENLPQSYKDLVKIVVDRDNAISGEEGARAGLAMFLELLFPHVMINFSEEEMKEWDKVCKRFLPKIKKNNEEAMLELIELIKILDEVGNFVENDWLNRKLEEDMDETISF